MMAAGLAMALTLVGCGSNDTSGPVRGEPPAAAAPAPSRGGVPAKLRSAIAATLKVDESRVTPDAAFADLGADDLSMVELVMAYEREFTVEIPDADADQFRRVQDVIDYLRQRNALE